MGNEEVRDADEGMLKAPLETIVQPESIEATAERFLLDRETLVDLPRVHRQRLLAVQLADKLGEIVPAERFP